MYINLSQNNLQRIPENVFDQLETLEELDLSYNSLKSLPANLFANTSLAILNLKGNSISNDLRFGGKMLQRLDLSFNQIHTIHHGMFDRMIGLTNLNLNGNDLGSIQIDSFISLKNLRYIDLSINKLEQVSSMLFYKNSKLEVMHLGDNPRLSQLPTDGFISHNGYFKIYYLDISNCAIGALGHKTFSTMPHLTTLKLAWNNINNLDRDTFASLTRLIDLDLSNNLIKKLDYKIFKNNNDLTKLSLAGNPLGRLSLRMFMPLRKLRELDVSDCDLTTLLVDNHNSYVTGKKYAFFETLRSFNASFNQIHKISSDEIRGFKHLRSLDISQNPLKCNEGFQDFIRYVSLNSQIFPHKMPSLERIIEDNSESVSMQLRDQSSWSSLAHEVCKHQDDLKLKRKFNRYGSDENAQDMMDVLEDMKSYKLSHGGQHVQKHKTGNGAMQEGKADSELVEKLGGVSEEKEIHGVVPMDVERKKDNVNKSKPVVVKDDDSDSDYDDDSSDTEEGDEEENEKSEERENEEDEEEEEDLEDDIDDQAHYIEEYAKMLRQLQEAAKKNNNHDIGQDMEKTDKFLLSKTTVNTNCQLIFILILICR